MKVTTHLCLAPRWRMCGAIPSLSHTPSWCGTYKVWLWRSWNKFIASIPYIYTSLRAITFKVLPLSNYALTPTMLPLVETLLELLLWNSFQCCFHIFFRPLQISSNLHPFKAVFIFGNSQSFWVKSGKKGGCSISVIDFWAKLGQSSVLFLCISANNCFNISCNQLGWLSGIVEWIQSEQYLDIKERDEHYLHLWSWHADFLRSLGCQLFPLGTLLFAFRFTLEAPCFISSDNFTQNLMLSHCSKKSITYFCNETEKHTQLINTTTSIALVLMHLNHNWCKLIHAETHLYYDQIAELPLSHKIKSLCKLHGHTTQSSTRTT
jgi:hypothetical protein